MTRGAGALRVLAYHAIAPLPPTSPLFRYGVPLADFRRHIDQLSRAGFTFIDAEGVLAFLHGRGAPARSVLLTFDDGHRSVEHAADVMERRGIPGVAFAISGALDDRERDFSGLGPHLDEAGLRRLVRYGFEIGAHSETHPRLTQTTDLELWSETAGALGRLRTAGLGRVRLFAYPYGDYDRRVRDGVERAGALAAFTVDPGLIRRADDRFTLRRIEIFRGDNGLAFRTKVETGGGLERVRAGLRVRSRLRRLLGGDGPRSGRGDSTLARARTERDVSD
jgi:peptidoglycan/xylan/chitin deacetylase (PgdA/CDA1 family)